MGSDDFISLDQYSDSDHQEEENGQQESVPVTSEADCRKNTYILTEGIHAGSLEKFGENGETEDGEHLQDMDVESDPGARHSIIENSNLIESVVMVDKLKDVQPEKASDDVCTLTLSDDAASNLLMDESPIARVKRARTICVDQQPCVRVVFNSLTRESKKKLMELMQQWSEWHAQFNSSSTVSSEEVLEYGEETYFPALHVGSEKPSTVSFWVDNQARNEDSKSTQLEDSVPFYDRGCILGSTSVGGSADSERITTLEASRCFNCGSYSHSLKECPKPRDNAAINSARKQHGSKRNLTPASRVQARYYKKTQGKFDDLKAGVLGPETRECLGIGELDPPPWLQRMRELGYPPGYLDVVEDEDQPSGITIFADEDFRDEYEDGELPEKADPIPPEKKMTVEFPGINAPIPENADQRRWANPPSSLRNRSHHRPNRPSDPHRAQFSDHQRNLDGPPGTEYGSGSGYRGHYSDRQRNGGPTGAEYRQRNDGPPGTEYGPRSGSSAQSNYSPRYGLQDHNNSPRTASPVLGRSLSDRGGWRSSGGYEGMHPVSQSPHSPYPLYSSGAQQSPAAHQLPSPSAQYPYSGGAQQSLAHQLPSPSARGDRWSHDSPFHQQQFHHHGRQRN